MNLYRVHKKGKLVAVDRENCHIIWEPTTSQKQTLRSIIYSQFCLLSRTASAILIYFFLNILTSKKLFKQVCYMFLPPFYFLCGCLRLKLQSCHPVFSEFSLVSILSIRSCSGRRNYVIGLIFLFKVLSKR